MVKRRREDEVVGVLEFEGRTSEDPEVIKWLAEHIAGHPSLTKPGAPNNPLVRLVLKATVANLVVRKLAGK